MDEFIDFQKSNLERTLFEGAERIIGICGSDEKCDVITKEFSYDLAINYKTQKVSELLPKNEIHVYFDNVDLKTEAFQVFVLAKQKYWMKNQYPIIEKYPSISTVIDLGLITSVICPCVIGVFNSNFLEDFFYLFSFKR